MDDECPAGSFSNSMSIVFFTIFLQEQKMRFSITISLSDLPTTLSVDSARRKFPDFPKDKGDLMVTTGWANPRSICHRDGRIFENANGQGGPGETIVLVFDDFVPGFTKDSRPEWYDLLWERILSVKAEAEYGPDQLIQVTEEIKSGCAVAKVRNVPVQCSHQKPLCYHVKISAEGNLALACAMALHQRILAGKTE